MIKTDIAFSQVREDPELDLRVLESLNKKNKTALVIGSGGCTILTMLLCKDLKRIDVIDANSSQLELLKLKIASLTVLTQKEYIDFMDAKENVQKLNIFSKLKDSKYFNSSYWKKPEKIKELEYGVNQIGVFEQLFKELRECLDENPMITLNKEKWDVAFNKVFDRQHLIDVFGEDAVKYSMSQEFSDHFSRVMNDAIEKYKNQNNYFLDQIFKGYYDIDLPIYLNNKNKEIILKNLNKINFINMPFHDFIKETENKYDFIHTSNITDWLPLHILDGLYKDINNHLSEDGLVISRRLNGDHCLREIISKQFETTENINYEKVVNYETRFKYCNSINLKDDDKSFFYNEVVVGKKQGF